MPPLPLSEVTNDSPSKTFGSSVTGIEYGLVVQPSVLRVDVQRLLSGDTDPFRRDNNEGEDKGHGRWSIWRGTYITIIKRMTKHNKLNIN